MLDLNEQNKLRKIGHQNICFHSKGAGSGIGRSVCRLLNRDGAMIVAADQNVAAAKEVVNGLNGNNHFIELDVSSKQSVLNGLQSIRSKFNSTPSIVVNSAGITKDNFVLKLDEEHFDDVIRVNLKVTNYLPKNEPLCNEQNLKFFEIMRLSLLFHREHFL